MKNLHTKDNNPWKHATDWIRTTTKKTFDQQSKLIGITLPVMNGRRRGQPEALPEHFDELDRVFPGAKKKACLETAQRLLSSVKKITED